MIVQIIPIEKLGIAPSTVVVGLYVPSIQMLSGMMVSIFKDKQRQHPVS
jgi:hypothetical protein